MAKQTSTFICSQCDYRSLKWIGCCPECKQWDSFQERITIASSSKSKIFSTQSTSTLHTINQLEKTNDRPRMLTGIEEWDRVVGGGIMPGSLSVLTGDPGIGKSTLLLQICKQLAQQHTVIYFSTEESLHQVGMRAHRIGVQEETLFFSDQSALEDITATILQHKPDIAIIDSIQNCYITDSQTTPGSINQLKEATFRLMRLAKDNNITIILTGHITKEGIIAGPKALEHMVDAVFYLQGENSLHTRLLRAVKNRFGTINELGFFEMHHNGLGQVANVNEHLLAKTTNAPGASLVAIMEGSRPLLLELQALMVESKMGIPQRVISGIDHKQVVLIAAILQKYLQIPCFGNDIFFKVSGGISNKETVTDLGIACALFSSYVQIPILPKTLIIGEISLTGQIKSVNSVEIMIKEAEKFGIEHLIVSSMQKIGKTNCKVYRLSYVYDIPALFEKDEKK